MHDGGMEARDDIYVAVRRSALSDLVGLAIDASAALHGESGGERLAMCLDGAVSNIRTDIRELAG